MDLPEGTSEAKWNGDKYTEKEYHLRKIED
jgi:hypothetical protein